MLAILQPHLLLDRRRRVHAHLRSRGEGLDPGAHGRARQGDQVHARGQEGDPQQADRGRGLREVPRRQIHRHQALRPRRRRDADPGARADHQARRRARREGHRPRHGPSRPAQRPHPGDAEAAPRALPRVQGRRLLPRRRRGFGRRQVPPRRLVGPRVRRQQGAPVADRQPLAPRDRRSGGPRQGARQAGPASSRPRARFTTLPQPGRPHRGAAAAAPRRRGLRRPGRHRRVPRALGPQGPPHRRLAPLRHQQPDRLHHDRRSTRAHRPTRPTSPR